ncbi:MAG: two-component sensor histidine kinase [Deltaproteobacteria bacterium]|nr:two-component sensor histidine kinase [Deltaproteobacteria bacterium]
MSVPDRERPADPDATSRLRALVEDATGLSGPAKARIFDALAAVGAEFARVRSGLDASKAELVAATDAHEAFAYSVSHDLRAPLRAIDGFARMLAEMPRGEPNAEADRFLAVICQSAKTMNDQLDGLLTLSRLERQDLRYTTIDMTDLAHTVVDEVRRREPARCVTVSLAGLEPAFGDLAMMRRLLGELVANAWKFTRSRPAATVEIVSHERATENVYVVCDDGVGFAPGAADRLFTAFRRLHAPAEFEGLGVGLAVVRTIVTRHRGRVWAEGEAGTGAKFYFSLPRLDGA